MTNTAAYLCRTSVHGEPISLKIGRKFSPVMLPWDRDAFFRNSLSSIALEESALNCSWQALRRLSLEISPFIMRMMSLLSPLITSFFHYKNSPSNVGSYYFVINKNKSKEMAPKTEFTKLALQVSLLPDETCRGQ